MEKLLSNGIRYQTVPESYIMPPETRPGNTIISCKAIPVIDLNGDDCNEVSKQILSAGKEFGFFQVVNHGVPENVIRDMMHAAEEFFGLPMEDKALYYSEDPRKPTRLNTSHDFIQSDTCFWRDYMRLASYPVEQFMHLWPEKPSDFRVSFSRYALEVRGLALRLLKLISEGLGLEEDYFDGDRSGGRVFTTINHYPPCPDPSLTLGLQKHCDPNLITLLLQGDVSGLQVLHQGEWIGVEPLPSAFVVNCGYQLEFITNGMLRSVEHRAVTNSTVSRTSIATFITPTFDTLIAPEKSLLHEHSPLYRPFLLREFFSTPIVKKGDRKSTLEAFMIKSI